MLITAPMNLAVSNSDRKELLGINADHIQTFVQKLTRKSMHKSYEELENIILKESDFDILNTVVESSKSRKSFKKTLFLKKLLYLNWCHIFRLQLYSSKHKRILT